MLLGMNSGGFFCQAAVTFGSAERPFRSEDDRYHCSRACTPQAEKSEEVPEVQQHAAAVAHGAPSWLLREIATVGRRDVGCRKVLTGTAWSVRRLPSGRRQRLRRL